MVLRDTDPAGSPGGLMGRWADVLAWVSLLIGIAAVSVVSDNVPFGGMGSVFAAGGRTALRVFALGIPVAISMAFWALALYLGQIRFRASSYLWWLAALMSIVVLSTIAAIDTKIAVFGSWYSEQGLLMWILYFSVAFLATQLIYSPQRLVQLVGSIVAVGAYVGGLGLLEVAGFQPLASDAPPWFFERGSSTMMNPDFLGTFLVAPVLLGTCLTVTLRGPARVASAGATLIALASLTFTLTRGAWLGVGVGLVMLSVGALTINVLASRRERATPVTAAGYVPARPARYPMATLGTVAAIWVSIALTVVLLITVVPGGNRIVERVQFTVDDTSAFAGTMSGRLPIWREIWAATLNRPLLGAGPDNLIYAWQEAAGYDFIRTSSAYGVVNSAHNVYLDLAVEFGIPFTLVFLAGVVGLVGRTIIALQRSAKAAPFAAWEIVALPVTAFGVGASFVFGMTVVPILATSFAIVGATIAIGTSSVRPLPKWGRISIVAVAATVSVALAIWGASSGQSAVVGNQAVNTPRARILANQAALRKAPWRVFPVIDMTSVADGMNDTDLSALSLSKEVAYERLIAADSHRSLNHYNAGNFYLLQRNDPARAIEFANKSLALQPVNPPANLLKGDALCATGDYDQGLALLAEAVRLESCAPIALSWEAPWDVYLSRLLEVAGSDANVADDARVAFSAFEGRFPGSTSLERFRSSVNSLP